jgi:hypothetical protein
VIELAAGIILGLRTPGQITERDDLLTKGSNGSNGHPFWKLEAPRMERVQTQFRVLEIIEIGLTVVGVGLATYGGAKQNHTLSGIGVGLAFEASTLLALDHLASERADRYANSITTFAPKSD